MSDTATHGPHCPIVPFLLSELYLGWEGEEGGLGNVAEQKWAVSTSPAIQDNARLPIRQNIVMFESQHFNMNENGLILWDIIWSFTEDEIDHWPQTVMDVEGIHLLSEKTKK